MFETALKERDEKILQQGKKESPKKLLKHGVSIQIIMECTGLSKE